MKQFLLSRLKNRWFLIPGFAIITALYIRRNLPQHPERMELIIVFYTVIALLAFLWPDSEWLRKFR